MEKDQFSLSDSLDVVRQFLGETAVEYFFGLLISETLDHGVIITEKDIIVKGY